MIRYNEIKLSSDYNNKLSNYYNEYFIMFKGIIGTHTINTPHIVFDSHGRRIYFNIF